MIMYTAWLPLKMQGTVISGNQSTTLLHGTGTSQQIYISRGMVA